jgi:hypothetical protein
MISANRRGDADSIMVVGRYKTKPSLPFCPEAGNHRRTRGLWLGASGLKPDDQVVAILA